MSLVSALRGVWKVVDYERTADEPAATRRGTGAHSLRTKHLTRQEFDPAITWAQKERKRRLLLDRLSRQPFGMPALAKNPVPGMA
jgi:hypothetical protein